MLSNKLTKVDRLIFETYLAIIKNSIGSKMFRNFYVKGGGGKKVDVMRNGEVSCAFYVSSILAILRLIKHAHGRVDITIDDMILSGWRKIKSPKLGAVLVWEKFDFGDSDPREHIGFYIGKKQAVSNDYKKRCPVVHSFNYNGKRKIKAIYWHKNLSRT